MLFILIVEEKTAHNDAAIFLENKNEQWMKVTYHGEREHTFS